MHTNVFVACLLTFSGFAPDALCADVRIGRFRDHRVESPSRRHYAVLRKEKRGIRFVICCRAAPAMALRSSETTRQTARYGKLQLSPDAGDHVLAEGRSPHLPTSTHVLDDPPALLLIGTYNSERSDPLITVIDGSGQTVFAHRLTDLYAAETIASLPGSVSGIDWMYTYFLDRPRRTLHLALSGERPRSRIEIREWLSKPRRLRSVSLDNGGVFTPRPGVLVPFFRDPAPTNREVAIELATLLEAAGLAEAARPLAGDADQPLAVRLRAAVAVKRGGGPCLYDKLFVAVVNDTKQDVRVRVYAARHLGGVLGLAALPILADWLAHPPPIPERGTWTVRSFDVAFGLASIGPEVVPRLIEWLGSRIGKRRAVAAMALGLLRSEEAVEPLFAALHSDRFVADAALEALVAINPPDLAGRLAGALAHGTMVDRSVGWRLAWTFATRAALKALALARNRAQPLERSDFERMMEIVQNALEKARGAERR